MHRRCYWILLSSMTLLTFYGCSTGTEAEDELRIAFHDWSDITYCGIDTLRVHVRYWTPYDDNADYDFYFDGMVNGQVEFTSFIVTENDLEYNSEERSLTLYWFGFAPSETYDLRVWFKKITGGTRAVDSVCAWSDSTAAVVDTSEYTLVKWCGDMRYGNGNNTDTLKEPAAYPIFVRVMNEPTGVGFNNKEVVFQAFSGSLTRDTVPTGSLTVPYAYEWLGGMGWTNLILSSGNTDYLVSATLGSQTVYFNVMGKEDDEVVYDDTLKIHEHWGDTTTNQISGDGLWGSNDPSQYINKNLRLEVDYDNTVISQTTLQNALNLLRDSLYSQVGIAVSYVTDNTFSSGYITRDMEKQLLAQHRNVNYKGIGKGYLHIIFAKMFENDSLVLCGRAVTYRDTFYENIGGSWCAHYGSGDMSITGHSQYYLDSVGCMLYVRPSCRTIPATFIDSAHILALITAHEIGHAIGLGHLGPEYPEYLDYGIMSARFFIVDTMAYNDYAYFAKPYTTDYQQRWLINLRKILGRETVDFMW